uniref:Genome polyprotein n=1 Tax=Fujian spotted paddle-tail newt picornavirus TaxID=2116428 RepID=A0A2P1GN34_9VIRU|nr:polyprotein [Fujian spotted paddle-tail newt picornavirus]
MASGAHKNSQSPGLIHGLIDPFIQPLESMLSLGMTSFLNDPAVEMYEGSDRIAALGAGVTTVVEQQAVEPSTSTESKQSSVQIPTALERSLQTPTLTNRFQRLSTAEWKPDDKDICGDAETNAIMSLPIPDIFFQTDSCGRPVFPLAASLQFHRFMRADFQFLIQTNAPPQQQGALLVVYHPIAAPLFGGKFCGVKPQTSEVYCSASEIGIYTSDATLLNFPHAILNLQANNSVILNVPFTYFRNEYDLITCMIDEKKSGTESDTCKKKEGGPGFRNPESPLLGVFRVYVLSQLKTKGNASTDKLTVSALGRMTKMTATGVRQFNPLPQPIEVLPVKSEVGAVVQPGAGSMDLSSKATVGKVYDLGLMPVPIRKDLSSFGSVPASDILEFTVIPSILAKLTVNKTDKGGKVLAAFPVSPGDAQRMVKWELETTHDVSTFAYDPISSSKKSCFQRDNNLSHFSRYFTFWKGSLNFHFQVVATQFHKGRIFVAFSPGDIPMTFLDNEKTFSESEGTELLQSLQAARFAVFDLGVETTFTFTVPFMSSQEFLRTDSYPSLQSCTGTVYVILWAPIVVPDTVSTSFDIVVYKTSGKDFQFFFPRARNITRVAKLQAGDGADGDETVQGAVTSIENSATGMLPSALPPSGSTQQKTTVPYSSTSISNFTGRSHSYARIDMKWTYKSDEGIIFLRIEPPQDSSLGDLFSCFTFWRGAMLFHLSMVNSDVCSIAYVPPGAPFPIDEGDLESLGVVKWDMDGSSNIIVRVPFYSPLNGLLTFPSTNHSKNQTHWWTEENGACKRSGESIVDVMCKAIASAKGSSESRQKGAHFKEGPFDTLNFLGHLAFYFPKGLDPSDLLQVAVSFEDLVLTGRRTVPVIKHPFEMWSDWNHEQTRTKGLRTDDNAFFSLLRHQHESDADKEVKRAETTTNGHELKVLSVQGIPTDPLTVPVPQITGAPSLPPLLESEEAESEGEVSVHTKKKAPVKKRGGRWIRRKKAPAKASTPQGYVEEFIARLSDSLKNKSQGGDDNAESFGCRIEGDFTGSIVVYYDDGETVVYGNHFPPRRGDVVRIWKGWYWHYGVYTKHGIFHMQSGSLSAAEVIRSHECEFLLEKNIQGWETCNVLDEKFPPLDLWKIENLCLAIVGRRLPYSVYSFNCEHCSYFIRNRHAWSSQASALMMSAVAAGVCGVQIGKVLSQGILDRFVKSKVDDQLTMTLRDLGLPSDLIENDCNFESMSLNSSFSAGSLMESISDCGVQEQSQATQILRIVMKTTAYCAIIVESPTPVTFLSVCVLWATDLVSLFFPKGVDFQSIGRSAQDVISKFSDSIRNVCENIRAESDSTPMLIGISKDFVSSLTGEEVFHSEAEGKAFFDGCKNFNTLTSSLRGIEYMFQCVLYWFQKFLDYVVHRKQPPHVILMKKLEPVYADWVAAASTIIKWDPEKLDLEQSSKLKAAVEVGKGLFTNATAFKNREIFGELKTLLAELLVFNSCVLSSQTTPQKRFEPIVLRLVGEAGQGKSTMAELIAVDLCKLHGVPEDSNIFTKSPRNEFFDAYKGQLVHIIDDIGQDPEDKDWAEFTIMCSVCDFRPPCADLTDKGTMYRTPYIILTSNFSETEAVTVRCSKAISRRLFMDLYVQSSPAYQTCSSKGQVVLDLGKAVKDGAVNDGSCFRISTSVLRGREMTMKDIVLGMRREYDKRFKIMKTMSMDRSTYHAGLLAEYCTSTGDVVPPCAKLQSSAAATGNDTTKQFAAMVCASMGVKSEGLCDDVGDSFDCAVRKLKDFVHKEPKRRTLSQRVLAWIQGKVFGSIPGWLKVAGAVSITLSIIVSGTYLWDRWATGRRARAAEREREETPPKEESAYGTMKITKTTVRTAVPKAPAITISQSSVVEITTKIANNMVTLTGTDKNNGSHYIIGIFLGDDILVFPKHFLTSISSDITVEHPKFTYVIKKDSCGEHVPNAKTPFGCIKMNGVEIDLAYAVLPKLPIHFKKLFGLMSTAEDLEKRISKDSMLLNYRREGPDGLAILIDAGDVEPYGEVYAEHLGVNNLVCVQAYRYKVLTTYGFCGSILLSKTPRGIRIFGMHVAGTGNGIGFSIPLYQSLYNQILVSRGMVELPTSQQMKIVAKREIPIYVPTRTKFEKAPFNGFFACGRQPAVLSERDARTSYSVQEMAFSKYLGTEIGYTRNNANTWGVTFLLGLHLGSFDRIPREIAIRGDGVGLNPIPFGTSAGLPFTEKHLVKRQLMDEQGDLIHPLIIDEITKLEESLLCNEVPEIEFTTMYKDELRPDEKVLMAKTRLIECSPLHFTIALRERMGEFMSKFHTSFGAKLHHMVGCDPEESWGDLYWGLKLFGNEGFSVDYSRWDSTVHHWMIKEVACVLGHLTTPRNAQEIELLFESMCVARHVFREVVYTIDQGLPSGTPCTTIINTIVNMMLVISVYKDLADFYCPEESSCQACGQNVGFVVYGDDCLMVPNSNVKSWFTPENFVKAVAAYGFSATSTQKDGRPIKFEPLEELTFLKRKFRPDDENKMLIHPVIEMTTIHSLLEWKSKRADWKDNVDNAARFLYHYGEEIYRKETMTWFKKMLQEKCVVEIPEFSELDKAWRGLFVK